MQNMQFPYAMPQMNNFMQQMMPMMQAGGMGFNNNFMMPNSMQAMAQMSGMGQQQQQ